MEAAFFAPRARSPRRPDGAHGRESCATRPQHRRGRIARRTGYSEAFGTPWLPFDTAAAGGDAYLASIVAKFSPAHTRSKDIMLASQAYALSARLTTLNAEDFELVADPVEIVVPEPRS